MSSKNKKTILLVEDEAITSIVTTKTLVKFGYNVVTADTGEKAIQTALSNKDIELILMDIDLGTGIDGTEAALVILKTRDIPVVFLSSHTESEIVEKTEKITSYGYIVKNTGNTILDVSIKMAFKLFNANKKTLEKEEKYRFLVENLNDVIFTLNTENIITYVSPQIERLSEYKVDDLIGKKFIEFVHPDDLPMLLERNTLFLNGLIEPWEFRVINKDASIKFVRTSSNLIKKDGISIGRSVLMSDISEHKKINEKIKQTSDLYSNLVEKVMGGFFQYKVTPDGQFSFPFVSKQISNVFGINPDQIQNDPSFLLKSVHPDDIEKLSSSILESAGTMKIFDFEFRSILPNNEYIWLLFRAQPEKLSDGSLVWYCFIADITEQKKNEEAMQKSISILNETGKFAKVGGWELDLTTGIPEWTDETFSIFEIDINNDAPLLPEGLNCYAPESRPIIAKAVERAIEFGESYDLELELITMKGNHRWVHTTGRPVYEKNKIIKISGSIQDISERKLAETSQQELNHRFMTLADNIPGFIAYVNAETLKYEFVNSSFEKSFGIPRDKIIGSHIKEIIGEDNYQFALKYINDVRSGKSSSYENSFDLVSGKRWIDVNYSPVFNSDKKVISIAVLSYDVTERKLIDEEIKIKNEQLQSSNEELNSAIEELEAANEELISTNENLIESEKELEQSETKLRNVLDATPFPVAVVDLVDDKIFYWSRSALSLFGHTAPTASEWYQIAYPDPDYRQDVINRWKPFLEKAQKTGNPVNTGEYRITCKDGSVRFCELYATFISSNLIVTFNDITDRKQLQEALKFKEEIYEDIFNTVSDGIAYTTLTGEVISINKSLEKILEIPMENIIGKNIINIAKDLLTAKNILNVIPHLKNLVQGKEFHEFLFEYNNKTLAISATINKESKRLTGLVRDITESKKSEELLNKNREMLNYILNAIPQSVFWKNLNGVYLGCNKNFADSVGLKSSENIIGKTDFDMPWLKEDAAAYIADDKYVIKNNKPKLHIIEQAEKADGTRFWADTTKIPLRNDKGIAYGVLGVYDDITDRKQAEDKIKIQNEKLNETNNKLKSLNEELIQSRKKYQQIVETAIEGVISLDTEGSITFISQQMSAMLGYTIEEMIGQKFEIFLPADQINDHYTQMKIRAQGKDSVYERCIMKKDGGKQWTIISAKSVTGTNGKPEGSFAMITDINDRKKSEENIQKLLKEKELILREVHHRIKNNMNTIYGLLILQANTLKDKTAIDALEDSANRVQSMMALYNKIYQSPDLQNISLSDYLPYLADEIIKNFPNSKSVKLKNKIDDFTLDSKRLQPLGIILNELLTNIMKYAFIGRKKGIISISAGLKPSATENTSTVSIIIHDNGIGMPESVDFENSSGFGLQLVWILTQELKGTISIERKDGTTVILEFEL